MTRDIAERLKYRKPCCIHGKMFPALQGFQFKMSGSDASSAVFLTDTFKVVQKKVRKFAFSGGGETSEMQREHGANLEVDIAYNWLKFFMEDDEKYAEIGEKYSKGEMMTGEVKDILIDILGAVIKKHQEARKGVTNEIVMEWMAVRPIKTTRD
jgi:tryptophanyl-tRNA synthetase